MDVPDGVAIGWGIVLVLLGALAWIGQTVSWIAPTTAARLGLAERPEDVEPVFAGDARGEAAWDACTLWTLLVAGVLLVIDRDAWAYFGLIGGGIYLYFAGRGIATRRVLRARGFRVGSDGNVKTAFFFLAAWGIAAAITICAAVAALPAP